MTDSFNSHLLNTLLTLFVLTWRTGFVLRVINNPAGWKTDDPKAIPSFRQIKVSGILRWLFGYKPVAGPVSMLGEIFQLAAFLMVGITALLDWVWPDTLLTIYWLPGVILALTLAVTVRFVPWLWSQQQGKK